MLADVLVHPEPSRCKRIARPEYTPDNVGRCSHVGSADGVARVIHHQGKRHDGGCTDVLRVEEAKAEIRARAGNRVSRRRLSVMDKSALRQRTRRDARLRESQQVTRETAITATDRRVAFHLHPRRSKHRLGGSLWWTHWALLPPVEVCAVSNICMQTFCRPLLPGPAKARPCVVRVSWPEDEGSEAGVKLERSICRGL
jgi:hypothetical protein